MTEFEKILQECLHALERGDATVAECLSRYPRHALQLAPVLLTAVDLERGKEAHPSAAFKARVRTRLTQEMRAYPRKTARLPLLFTRLTTSFAVILLALLLAGTVYAQSALPGNAFYNWKLTSENIWRVISPDPVGTDLAIADRRADELITIGNNSAYHDQVLKSYLKTVSRLKAEMNADNEARIRSVLNSQIQELNQSGTAIPSLDPTILPGPSEPITVPTTLPQMNSTVVVPTTDAVDSQTTVPVISTRLPKIVPTVKIPPLIP